MLLISLFEQVAQVAAHELGIPLSKVLVKPSNNLVAANSDTTGGAVTSELVAYVRQLSVFVRTVAHSKVLYVVICIFRQPKDRVSN